MHRKKGLTLKKKKFSKSCKTANKKPPKTD